MRREKSFAPHQPHVFGDGVYRSITGTQAESATQSTAKEQQLLQRIAAGECTALWQLWASYHDYLRDRCIRWMSGDPVEAEDALSTAMLKVYEHLPERAHEITNVKAWLIRVTHNLCVDMQRKRTRQPTAIEHLDELHVPSREAFGSPLGSPETLMIRQEIWDCLQRSLADLPPHLRESLQLRLEQEKAYPEIAAQLAISNANVRKRVQMARHLLRKRFYRHVYGRPLSLAKVPADRGQLN
ncbi:RNA polymerase sigma factor [Candidatus Entotheonella serta]|nr:RNA polymerase sigma factor [Candidatus Entotheonella serta]